MPHDICKYSADTYVKYLLCIYQVCVLRMSSFIGQVNQVTEGECCFFSGEIVVSMAELTEYEMRTFMYIE